MIPAILNNMRSGVATCSRSAYCLSEQPFWSLITSKTYRWNMRDCSRLKLRNQIMRPRVQGEEALIQRARFLATLDLTYNKLNPEDQKAMDFFQKTMYKEGGVYVPNSREAQEQEEIDEMLFERLQNQAREIEKGYTN